VNNFFNHTCLDLSCMAMVEQDMNGIFETINQNNLANRVECISVRRFPINFVATY